MQFLQDLHYNTKRTLPDGVTQSSLDKLKDLEEVAALMSVNVRLSKEMLALKEKLAVVTHEWNIVRKRWQEVINFDQVHEDQPPPRCEVCYCPECCMLDRATYQHKFLDAEMAVFVAKNHMRANRRRILLLRNFWMCTVDEPARKKSRLSSSRVTTVKNETIEGQARGVQPELGPEVDDQLDDRALEALIE